MGKYDKFFAAAKEAGLKEAELTVIETHSRSISLFHGEIDNYSDENGMNVIARGVFSNGKCGVAVCDTWNKDRATYLINEIVNNAKVIENDDPVFIYKGSDKYHKVNTFNKELNNVPIDVKINKLKELEASLKSEDSRIADVAEVGYNESNEVVTIVNTNGLKLTQKNNYMFCYGEVVAEENGVKKSGFDFYFGNDFKKFDIKELSKKIAEDATSKLGGIPCPAKKCKVVLSPDAVSPLLRVYVGHADSEQVQKKSSYFIGKLHQKVASKKLTIEDRPLAKTVFARSFDDEGVATYNKAIVKKGVLETYLYNLVTACKDGVQTTGNARGAGSKKVASPFQLYIKPGNKSQEDLFKKVGDGVFITSVTALHSGMNPQSGDFSLSAEGFEIVDGKKGKPFDLITVSGNLFQMFNDVVEVGKDLKLNGSGSCVPSLYIKKLGVSGK